MNVTEKDLEHGQIRNTHEAKRGPWPTDAGATAGASRREEFTCTYDLRFSSDQEVWLLRLGMENLTRILGGLVELAASRGQVGAIDLT
jgi:hypothetical protein